MVGARRCLCPQDYSRARTTSHNPNSPQMTGDEHLCTACGPRSHADMLLLFTARAALAPSGRLVRDGIEMGTDPNGLGDISPTDRSCAPTRAQVADDASSPSGVIRRECQSYCTLTCAPQHNGH
jgi:hypothetical protein